MKLYVFPIAPNPTRVRLYLAEKAALGCRIPIEEVTVDLLERQQRSPEHRARNPFGTLPVLELDSGRHLIESLVIIDHLEAMHPSPAMFGEDPEMRSIARQIERIADLGVLLPIGAIVHATDSPVGYPANPPVAEYQRKRLPSSLRYLEGLLDDGRPFLAGERPTVGDCTLAAALQFGRFRKLEFLDGYPGLSAWDARYRARETARSVLVAYPVGAGFQCTASDRRQTLAPQRSIRAGGRRGIVSDRDAAILGSDGVCARVPTARASVSDGSSPNKAR
jgi:glutathione S-transferase